MARPAGVFVQHLRECGMANSDGSRFTVDASGLVALVVAGDREEGNGQHEFDD